MSDEKKPAFFDEKFITQVAIVDDATERLDRQLARLLPDLSRSRAQTLIAQGQAQAAKGMRDDAHRSWQEAVQQLQTSVGADAPATRHAAQLLAQP